jgi:hypothetical protein
MPDPQLARSRQMVAMALMASALLLGAGAMLIYAGILSFVAEDVRSIVALALGTAAALDFFIGIWFFRMGQSS